MKCDEQHAFRRVVYLIFLSSCLASTLLAQLLIWELVDDRKMSHFVARLLGTCAVVALASALTISTTQMASRCHAVDPDADDAAER